MQLWERRSAGRVESYGQNEHRQKIVLVSMSTIRRPMLYFFLDLIDAISWRPIKFDIAICMSGHFVWRRAELEVMKPLGLSGAFMKSQYDCFLRYLSVSCIRYHTPGILAANNGRCL